MSGHRAEDSSTSSTSTVISQAAQLSHSVGTNAPPLSKLLTFQTAVGIPIRADHNPYSIYRKNRGIWKSVTRAEAYSIWSYRLFEFVITTCLIMQILLAATLTALGASSSSHISITLLGAVNTALAGTVALLKGQGLPNRLRQDWNSWRSLRDYIEEKEREIGCGKPGVDVWAEVKIIEDRYESVRKNQEKNRPDTYSHLDKENHGGQENEKSAKESRAKAVASF